MEKKSKFKRVPADISVTELTPLNITCSSTKCDDGLHCFRTNEAAAKKFGEYNVCKECGAKLIDWQRVHKNDLRDVKFVFKSMKYELIRHVYWHTDINPSAIEKASKYSKNEMRDRVRTILKTKIGKLNIVWDGRQTPMVSNEIVNYAQHATATCCRKCLEYWHNIPKETILNDDQLDYCTQLVMLYLEERIPKTFKKENMNDAE
jgi:hypothetical protein